MMRFFILFFPAKCGQECGQITGIFILLKHDFNGGKRKSVYGKTEQEAKRKRREWKKNVNSSAVLGNVMKPLTEKYHCSYSNLVQAWTLLQNPGINLLTGFTRPETMINTCESLRVCLSPEDAALMEEAAKPAQVRELDK